LENILNLELNLNSNSFGKNIAKNGGALYIGKEKISDTQFEDKAIIFENNNFYENYAQMFGGAILLEYNKMYLAKTKNNNIINNKADIMGAGIYFSDPFDSNIMDIDGFEFSNNTVSSIIDNYTTKPAYIYLNSTLSYNLRNINNGIHFPLTFTLNDKYGNIILDINKFYSIITFKLNIKLKYNKSTLDNTYDNNFYLLENTCSFIKGNNIYIIIIKK